MRVCSRRDLVWDDKQLRLHSIRGRVLAAIEPDREWPGMWRVRMPDGYLTDMREPVAGQGCCGFARTCAF